MKIGLVLSSTPGYSETFFTSKIKGLQEQGFSVVLLTQTIGADFDLCPVVKAPKVYSNIFVQVISMAFVFFKLVFHLKSVLNFIKLERQEKSKTSRLLKKVYLNSHLLSQKLDWLHFGFTTQALGSELVAKAIGAKMAVSFRGFDMAIYPLKSEYCYDLLWKHLDKVHTISNDLLELAYSHGMSKEIPVVKITPAINSNTFKKVSSKVFKNDSDRVVEIVTIARLHWKKGIVSTIEALAILKKQGVKFRYTIIGEGEEYERICFAIHQLKLQDRVFLVGKKAHEEVVRYLEDSEIYIQFSISEGFCNAVLEAQAMGLLCVVSDAEGLPENVIHNQTGWVVPKRQTKLLAEQIQDIINLADIEKNRISKNAINRVVTTFNVKDQQKQFVDFYVKEARL
jgi:colanic acid/amylovoran biosynthesis glycosyltransferase